MGDVLLQMLMGSIGTICVGIYMVWTQTYRYNKAIETIETLKSEQHTSSIEITGLKNALNLQTREHERALQTLERNMHSEIFRMAQIQEAKLEKTEDSFKQEFQRLQDKLEKLPLQIVDLIRTTRP